MVVIASCLSVGCCDGRRQIGRGRGSVLPRRKPLLPRIQRFGRTSEYEVLRRIWHTVDAITLRIRALQADPTTIAAVDEAVLGSSKLPKRCRREPWRRSRGETIEENEELWRDDPAVPAQETGRARRAAAAALPPRLSHK